MLISLIVYMDKRYWMLLIPAIIILIVFDHFAPNGVPISALTFVGLFWLTYFLWKYLSDKKKDNNHEVKRPWYLEEDWVYALCTLTPPIGLINVLINRKWWPHEDGSRYLGVAIFFNVLIWVIPSLTSIYYGDFSRVWMDIVIILVIILSVVLWPKKE